MSRPEKEEKVFEFLDKNQAAFANFLNISSGRDAFIEAFDPRWQGNLPFTMVIAPGSELIYTHDGIIDPLEVKKAIVGKLGRYFADDLNLTVLRNYKTLIVLIMLIGMTGCKNQNQSGGPDFSQKRTW